MMMIMMVRHALRHASSGQILVRHTPQCLKGSAAPGPDYSEYCHRKQKCGKITAVSCKLLN